MAQSDIDALTTRVNDAVSKLKTETPVTTTDDLTALDAAVAALEAAVTPEVQPGG